MYPTPEGTTAEMVIDAYSMPPVRYPTEDQQPLHDAKVHVLGNKYTKGGDPIDYTVSVFDMLTEKWPCDLHYTMYNSPSATRLVKDLPTPGIKFEIVALDLDFDNHNSRPTIGDFADLVANADLIIDEHPNVVYETRGGARFIYIIEPMIDEAWEFENYYQALIGLVANYQCWGSYNVDTAAKDWTRLFRAPLVTRDGEEEFNRQVRVLHNNLFSLTDLKAKPKKAPTRYAPGSQVYRGHDKRIIQGLAQMQNLGNRNFELYKVAAHAFSTYEPHSQELILDLARTTASQAGLDDREIEQTINSARKRAERATINAN